MILTVVLLGICQILTAVCVLWLGMTLLDRWAARKQRILEERLLHAIHEWVDAQPPDDKGNPRPSKLAEAAALLGQIVGSAAARSLMASVKQDASSVSQVAGSMADQLQAQTNPLMALMGGGKRGKGSAVLRLAEMLGPMLAGKNNGNGATDRGSEYTGRRHRE